MVGGGLVGLATAYRLLQRFPGSSVTLLEKESHVAAHQSSHNSGVLHCGLYYKPGSKRAVLARRGIRQMVDFCREHGIRHEVCGKLVVAVSDDEVSRLRGLLERGQQNGLVGLKLLSAAELLEIEPHAAGVQAIHVPEEGIADYPTVAAELEKQIRGLGGEVLLNAAVHAMRRGSEWTVEHSHGSVHADWVISCAGLHSDRVAALSGRPRSARIVPFRGEYFLLRPERQHLVRNLIYPVPDPRFPFLGVHFTRMAKGGVEAGPNAVLAFAREGYRRSDVNVGDLADALGFPGLWKFLRKYPDAAWMEIKRSFSKELFLRTLQRLVPEIQLEDLLPGGAGVRAQALNADGSLIDDFLFVQGEREIHVVNAPSPGATSSLAIGEEVASRIPN